ncbi:hypothetical protein [Hyalangium versicolor]|uniref:hypothetical protein n=1 Tax=Hyalangium versicolor TaxID=2861190 RepID=UPI001CC94BD5|nr:hypothetical protein [Hyalangium versicolor]
MTQRRSFWGVMGCLLLWMGCGSSKPYMARPEQLSKLSQDTGVVVGSLARATSTSRYHTCVLRFWDKKTRQERTLFMKHLPGGNEFDFSGFGRSGDLFALVLPAGDYALDSASFETEGSEYHSGPDLYLLFTVPPGGILYLGEFLFGPSQRPSPDYRSLEPLLQLSRRDEWDRDSALLKARYPNVAWSKVLRFNVEPPEEKSVPPVRTNPPDFADKIEQLLDASPKAAPTK